MFLNSLYLTWNYLKLNSGFKKMVKSLRVYMHTESKDSKLQRLSTPGSNTTTLIVTYRRYERLYRGVIGWGAFATNPIFTKHIWLADVFKVA